MALTGAAPVWDNLEQGRIMDTAVSVTVKNNFERAGKSEFPDLT